MNNFPTVPCSPCQSFCNAFLLHHKLLSNLKTKLIDHLLNRDSLEHLLNVHESLEQIFSNGIRLFKPDSTCNIWKFIQGLNWLNPSLTVSIADNSPGTSTVIPNSRIKRDNASTWIYESLKAGDLSEKLSYLLSDRDHLNNCYEITAFFQSQRYVDGLMCCLKALETNQPKLLSNLEGLLNRNEMKSPRKLRSCSKLRAWNSMPVLHTDTSINIPILRKTVSQSIHLTDPNVYKSIVDTSRYQYTQKVPSFAYDKLSNESQVDGPQIQVPQISVDGVLIPSRCDDIKIHFDRKHTPITERIDFNMSPSIDQSTNSPYLSFNGIITAFMSAPKILNVEPAASTSSTSDFVHTFLPRDGEKIRNSYKLTSVFDDRISDGSNENVIVNKLTTEQSLTNFLQSVQFSQSNTDLERENAHFRISEVMISAIEQIKWTQIEDNGKNERLIDRDCYRSKLSSCLSDASTSSVSGVSSSPNSIGSSETETLIRIDKENITGMRDSPRHSQSSDDHIAYAEWGANNSDALSAEGVALSLISKFKDKQIPRAVDLLWLVSEQDAPQQLLPLPGSLTINPDEVFKIPYTRGTRDWAPPRAQVIFTKHPSPDRNKLLRKQNQRCAGCGMKVAKAYIHCFRYCEYLGKYHCTGCHRNQLAVIPARILTRWDFTCRPVSIFAYRLLDQMWNIPLFRVNDLNPKLYERVNALSQAKLKRIQLKFIEDFIMTCRFVNRPQDQFINIQNHITTDPDIWSLSDFMSVRNGIFIKQIKAVILRCEKHVFECVLCMARGFHCELCPKKDIIFPWQTKVKRCNGCGSCYHEWCWRSKECGKCIRLLRRGQGNS